MNSWPRFLGILLIAAVSGCGAAAPLNEQIDAIFRTAHQQGKFNGSVLVTRKDRTLYEQSFGPADVEKNLPNTNDTRFLAFSVVKPMTAVLVFQQVEAGKVRLEDKLESIFPGLAAKPVGKITLQQLLTHTSGVQEIIGDRLDRRITLEELGRATVKANADFEYSSTGYVCLGLVLEAVTGRSYEDLLREKILEPAGMKDSGLARSGVAVPTLARGYRMQAGKLAPAELGVALGVLDGAGSLYTTARDLWRFDRALAAEKILSRKMQDVMLTQQVKGRFGYGWFLSEQGGRYFPWHKGDFRGHAAMFVRQINRGETIVILSNLEEADVLGLRTKILQLLKAHPAP
ncbi:MAG TPA: serine hydrolase domain-containing protein [Opitutaceae bacterium]|nr:serine hydrolase domain-containing protein [Opitutaceae bacterium]